MVIPTFDVLLAILHVIGTDFHELTAGLVAPSVTGELTRKLYAVQTGGTLAIHFEYAEHDAQYHLAGAEVQNFDALLREFRDGLAGASAATTGEQAKAIKADAVARAFLRAVSLWPTANPSDLWWFLIYRAYCDPFNHPAKESRRDFGQGWRRTGGWALERVLVSHYGPWLAGQSVRLFIAEAREKQRLLAELSVPVRLEADKVDVLLTTPVAGVERCFGVVHVKASFAERRTDDVPMSKALVDAGYTSPLWTMDSKSGPSTMPVNRGELGRVRPAEGPDTRSAKRKDIEDDGYFSACFSYNRNTLPTPEAQSVRARVVVCDFQNPDDSFSQFIVAESQRFRARGSR
jgi:hypothetical protein